MPALAQVVRVRVHHQRASDDVVRALERDLRVADGHLGNAVVASLDVAQVAHVAHVAGGAPVLLVVGVEVGPRGDAAVGVVAEFVDVETVKALAETADFAGDFDRRIPVLDGRKRLNICSRVGKT